MKQLQKFRSKIYKIGINPVVDPPKRVLAEIFEQAGRDKGPIPVYGRLNGKAFIQTLVNFAARGGFMLTARC